jgi:hypothetical protein
LLLREWSYLMLPDSEDWQKKAMALVTVLYWECSVKEIMPGSWLRKLRPKAFQPSFWTADVV